MKTFKVFLSGIIILVSFKLLAQFPRGESNGRELNTGKMYGKLLDSLTGKPIEFATLFVYANKFDTINKVQHEVLLTGAISTENGDFNLEGLPIVGKMKLKIKIMGYKDYEQELAFNVNMKEMTKPGNLAGEVDIDEMNGNKMGRAFGAIDKDIGNIRMVANNILMQEVKITADISDVEIKIDKTIYNVGKDITVTGGTAEDVLKNVPSVTVDMDGNLSMRNASPQLFVDGRPSTLSIDQIPADAIERVEVMANPSAKYDASGGMAGIINIVLKKNRMKGYYGNIRMGVDQRGKIKLGADLNVKQGKWNFFISGSGNQRNHQGVTETTRENLVYPRSIYSQTSPTNSNGFFGFGRGGVDYFIDNRNTLTLSGNYMQGTSDNNDQIKSSTDYYYDTIVTHTENVRYSDAGRNFRNYGGALLFKHLFPTEGRELTSDLNYNRSNFLTDGLFETRYNDNYGNEIGIPVKQKQDGTGGNTFFTFQTDYSHPFKNTMKLMTGVRASVKNSTVNNKSYLFNSAINEYQELKAFGANYKFDDQVYAGYLMFSNEISKFSYQVGLRLESSFYSGQFIDSTEKYLYQYPVSLFPNLSGSYKFKGKNSLQLNISRRVNRPGIFQLIPVTDYSDSLNITKGNPALKPEFTNSVELTFMHNFNRKNYVSLTGYYKYTTDLISSYQNLEYNADLQKNIVVNSYNNSNFSNAYGSELSSKFYLGNKIDISPSANLYYAVINSTNVDASLINKRLNYFFRMKFNVEINKNLSLQLNGNYTGKSNQPVNEKSDRGGGNHGAFFGSTPSTAQGYILPVYYLDAGLKYGFLKEKKASLTLNVSDFLKTRVNQTHTESEFFIQDVTRKRDQLFFRLNFSYRFGKADMSIFKKKNMNMNTDSMDVGM